MIRLQRLDHVCLRVADLDEAAARWALQFGLVERQRENGRALLACNDEAYCLELVESGDPGHEHAGFELAVGCSLDGAREHLESKDVAWEEREGSLFVADHDGRGIQIMPFREPASEVDRRPQHARPSSTVHLGGPRKLGHVNCLTAAIHEGVEFYVDVLGMGISDWLEDGGVWFHVNTDHHVMALVDKGYAHFHHLAFETVDIGKMRDMLDHLARHGRWLGWGPTRHGIAGNIASYVRIPEESCFVELYCDMEQLQQGHVPRIYPDDRYSSNTWGPLPPRSYFRFDPEAIEYERQSLETLGYQLPPLENRGPTTPHPTEAADRVPTRAPMGSAGRSSKENG
jgi:catechol-2,3-dioxygenase